MDSFLRVLAKICRPGNVLNKCLMWGLGVDGVICLILGLYHNYTNDVSVFLKTAPIGAFCISLLVITKNYGLVVHIKKSLGGGNILEWLLPPDEADYRIIELDEAMDRWVDKYGQKRAEILYIWQSLISVALFWFDRVVVKVLARK